MRAKALSLLQELTEAHSVSGHEDEVRAIFTDELTDIGPLAADRNGSVICAHTNEGPRVLIAGHMDEIGFMAQNLTPDGFIQFVPIGGWDANNVSIGYINVGAGRLWLVEADWQDSDNNFTEGSRDLMAAFIRNTAR